MNKDIKKLLREGLENNKESNLTPKDKVVFDYIIGEDLNEGPREIINKFSKVLKLNSKKAVLNAALITALMGNVAFSNAIAQAPDSMKQEISQIMSSSKKSDVKAPISSSSVFSKDLSNNFSSGSYKLTGDYNSLLSELKDFIDENGIDGYKIKITASESQVPNQAPFNKIGSLASKRAEMVNNLIQKKLSTDIDIDLETKVGEVKWDGGDKDDDKYTKDQYVKLEIFANAETLCDIDIDDNGKIATPEKGFIAAEKKVNGKGYVDVLPGTIPDRFVISANGNLIADTGYISTEEHSYSQWNLVPDYIATLTTNYKNHGNLDAFKNLGNDLKTFNSFEELVNTLLKDKNFDYSKDNRSEISNGLSKLKNLWDSGVKEFLFYKKSGTKVNIDTNGQDADFMVYSAVGKTGFSAYGNCD